MNRLALFVAALAVTLVATGCPKGPEQPSVDTGDYTAPSVPAEDSSADQPAETIDEPAATAPAVDATNAAPTETPAAAPSPEAPTKDDTPLEGPALEKPKDS